LSGDQRWEKKKSGSLQIDMLTHRELLCRGERRESVLHAKACATDAKWNPTETGRKSSVEKWGGGGGGGGLCLSEVGRKRPREVRRGRSPGWVFGVRPGSQEAIIYDGKKKLTGLAPRRKNRSSPYYKAEKGIHRWICQLDKQGEWHLGIMARKGVEHRHRQGVGSFGNGGGLAGGGEEIIREKAELGRKWVECTCTGRWSR